MVVLALAACAPTQQGADETSDPSSAAESMDAEHSMDMESPGASGGDSGEDPDDYDY